MIDKNDLIETLKAMHNDICIVGDTELCRLIGFHEDERDYYYTIRQIGPVNNRHTHFTAVGWIFSLKGVIPQERYDNLDRVFTLNGAGPTDEFMVTEDLTPYEDNTNFRF